MKTSKSTISNDEVSNLIKLVLIVTGIFALFYALTIFLTKEEEPIEEEEVAATIQYDNILTANILNRSQEEYYVIIYKSDKYIVDAFKTYAEAYTGITGSSRVYYSDLNNEFNQRYLGDSNNIVSDIDDLMFSDDVLLKIEDGKIEEEYIGKDAIYEELIELAKEDE